MNGGCGRNARLSNLCCQVDRKAQNLTYMSNLHHAGDTTSLHHLKANDINGFGLKISHHIICGEDPLFDDTPFLNIRNGFILSQRSPGELLSNVVYGALGSVPHFFNAIDESCSTDYLSWLPVTIKTLPSFLSTLTQLT